MAAKKLYKVSEGKVFCGVCAGLGEYLNLDPNIVRLLALLIALCSFGVGMLIVYIVMACILPDKTSVY